jgi:hypothetical protein
VRLHSSFRPSRFCSVEAISKDATLTEPLLFTECVEGEFLELRNDGALGSPPPASKCPHYEKIVHLGDAPST